MQVVAVSLGPYPQKRPFLFEKMRHIRSGAEYAIVKKKGKKYRLGELCFCLLENELPFARLGLVVSKKVGNAVVRNRIKRLLREAFRKNEHFLQKGLDIVVVLTPSAVPLTYERAVSAFAQMEKR